MELFTKAAFYIVAHADDWQLFMAPEISRDIGDKQCKTIIIHTTAGDAGRNADYWRAREKAAIDSLVFRTSGEKKPDQHETKVMFGDKDIFTASVNNCTCYFLRIPDGDFTGNGFPDYNYQSLEKFRTGRIDLICSTDGTSVYSNWTELADVIDKIIEAELSELSFVDRENIFLNFSDHDTSLNVNNHNDHYNTSLLMQSTESFMTYKSRAFLDYAIINRSSSLSGEDLFWKIGMFCSYHQSLLKETGHSTLSEDDLFIPCCFKSSNYRQLRTNQHLA